MTQIAVVDGFAPKWQRIDARRAARVLLGIPLRFGLFLFLPAGTLVWPRAWVFVLVSLAEMAVQFGLLWQMNPDVVIARSRFRADSKLWDKLLLCCYLPTVLAILIVAALDDGHFHWFPLPWRVSALGIVLYLLGFGLITWAQAVNKFFEPTVRIQSDRGQRAIASGPYTAVRHPGYVGGVFVSIGTALSLGSLWALIPALGASALLLLRTHWEDQTLQHELVGYQQYAARVRYKLVPLIW
jgi:protein-S-isoprenylcysteine O-methyltransferase Ste14